VKEEQEMARQTEADIVVDVPVEVVYRAWSDFESFPRFMSNVKEVRRLDPTGQRLRWKATVAGAPQEWEAEVIDLTPNQRVAWRSVSGSPNDGTVELEPQGDSTRVLVRMSYEPPSDIAGETADALTQATQRAVLEDLRSFKQLIETGQVTERGGGLPWAVWFGIGLGGTAVIAGIAVGLRLGLRQRQSLTSQTRRPTKRDGRTVRRGLFMGTTKGAARGTKSDTARGFTWDTIKSALNIA
jgi:uncharacterized membrane protein